MLCVRRIIWLLTLALIGTAEAAPRVQYLSGACTGKEKWNIASLGEELADEFRSTFKYRSFHVEGFALGQGVEKSSKTPMMKAFGAYWKSRALFGGKYLHLAVGEFNKLLSRPVKAATAGVQYAALECMNQIYAKHPTLYLEPKAMGSLRPLLRFPKKHAVWEAAKNLILIDLSEGRSYSALSPKLSLLRKSGPYENLARGMVNVKQRSYGKAVAELEKFLKSRGWQPSLNRHKDTVHMILGQIYLLGKKHAPSIQHFKKVNAKSNKFAIALNDMSWAYFQSGKFKDAVGAARSFQQGNLRNTFAPEAVITMAMIFNELCQYPESMRLIKYFGRKYTPTYRWLRKWKTSGSRNMNYYAHVVKHLEGEKTKIPRKVMTEWIRSPVFLSHQGEINLMMDEKDQIRKFIENSKGKYADYRDAYREAVQEIAELKRTAVEERRANGRIPASVRTDYRTANHRKRKSRDMITGMAYFRNIAKRTLYQMPLKEQSLVRKINQDLNRQNAKMMAKLRKIGDATGLVQAIIYNGASQDIVWQNAHPEYKEFVESLKPQKKDYSAGQVLNWGRSTAAVGEEEGEMWEDEIGTLKVEVIDKCMGKEAYLKKLKKKR